MPTYLKADQVPINALKTARGQDVGVAIAREKNVPIYQGAAEQVAFSDGPVFVGVRASRDGKGFYIPYQPTKRSKWRYAKVSGHELGVLLASDSKFKELAKPLANRARSDLEYGSVALITDRPPNDQTLRDVAKGLESAGMGTAGMGGPAGNVKRVNIKLD